MELRHCDSNSPMMLARNAVAKSISHQVQNSPCKPIMKLPIRMYRKVWIRDTPATNVNLEQM